MATRTYSALFSVVVAINGVVANATTLPQSYPLRPAEKTGVIPDGNLERWISQHADKTHPRDLSERDFASLLASSDLVSRSYLALIRPKSELDGESVKPILNLITEISTSSDSILKAHPLLPYLYYEVLKSEVLTPEKQADLEAKFRDLAHGSCTGKRHLYDALTPDYVRTLDHQSLDKTLKDISSYRSQKFRRSAFKKIAMQLSIEQQEHVGNELLLKMSSFPRLVQEVPWLRGKSEIKDDAEKNSDIGVIKVEANRRKCGGAKAHLNKVLHNAELLPQVDDAINVAKAVDDCYKATDRKGRVDFWKSLQLPLAKRYGFEGELEGQMRVALIHWFQNDFSSSRPIFLEVRKLASGKSDKYASRALYALAKQAENEGHYRDAETYYSEYVAKYKDGESYEDSLMSLVLAYVDTGNWQRVVDVLRPWVDEKSSVDIDQRPIGVMSFSLFWLGRGYLEVGKRSVASEIWRRGATEYFSTYYGALSHYMLEKMLGQALALEPQRSPPFRMHALRAAFTAEDQATLKRAETLMSLGLTSEAVCELEEIDADGNSPERTLVRALMLHAAGSWLDAVKAFDSLPRSFRNMLPLGAERILFPIRYSDRAREFAKRAGIEAELVLAIIRQESVFNPKAQSQVGAMGLMQLMPPTARLELKRIASDYLSSDEKKNLQSRLKSDVSLLDEELNLTIGVHHVRSLLNKYQNPIYVLSAYNASPAAAHRWMSQIPTADPLAFIERIPYKETRAYVKLVLRNYFYYKRWYGGSNAAMPQIDTVAVKVLSALQAANIAGSKPLPSGGGEAPVKAVELTQ